MVVIVFNVVFVRFQEQIQTNVYVGIQMVTNLNLNSSFKYDMYVIAKLLDVLLHGTLFEDLNLSCVFLFYCFSKENKKEKGKNPKQQTPAFLIVSLLVSF